MRKITLMIASCLMTAMVVGQNPIITTEWEISSSNSTLPDWIGTGGTVRGMGFGTFQSNNVLVVPTRTPSLAFKVINASNGTVLFDLNTTGVTGGDVAVSDAAITLDGKILAANVIVGNATTAKTFKVYRWDNSTSNPTVAISYQYTNTNRYGDHISVSGSITDGTAKVYAASTALSGGIASIICFSMVSDGNGGYIFNQTPSVVSSAVTSTGSYASIDFLPDGSFLLKSNAQQIRKYNADGSYANDVSLGTVVATGGASLKYLKTTTAYQSGDPDTTYVVYFRYGTGQEKANVLRLPGGSLANATVSNTTPSLGANSNTGGSGKIAVESTLEGTYIYVLSTNNGLGKYKITWPWLSTGTQNTLNTDFKIILSNDVLKIEGASPSSIWLYNTLGQKVKSTNSDNRLDISGLCGVHIVKVNINGRVSTQKVSL